jgi:hypothetical protein
MRDSFVWHCAGMVKKEEIVYFKLLHLFSTLYIILTIKYTSDMVGFLLFYDIIHMTTGNQQITYVNFFQLKICLCALMLPFILFITTRPPYWYFMC